MKAKFLAGLVLVALIAPRLASSEPAGCRDCGCVILVKTCRLVPDIKKETQINWVCESEDICLPGRSRRCGGTCCNPILEPQCGRIITRKKLRKETVTVEKPGFKCVVETVCRECGACCNP